MVLTRSRCSTTAAARRRSSPRRVRPALGSTVRGRGDRSLHPDSLLHKGQHLRIAVVGPERPVVVEDDRLIMTPVLIENLSDVLGGDRARAPGPLR